MRASLRAAEEEGAIVLYSSGAPTDVALARNLAWYKAEQVLVSNVSLDVVVHIDDDMVFGAQQIATLAALSRHQSAPVSGSYILKAPPYALAASELDDPKVELASEVWGPRVYAGLGAMACPVGLLGTLIARSVRFTLRSPETELDGIPALVSCGPGRGQDGRLQWASEDWCWCARIDAELGAPPVLAPVSFGHLDTATDEIWWPTWSSPIYSDAMAPPWRSSSSSSSS